jgi:hypothetical protein
MHRAQDINGKKYDLLGLGSFSSELSIIKPDPNKYWCSEACAELIKAAYFLGENFVPHKFTPVGLFFTLYDEIAIHSAPLHKTPRPIGVRAPDYEFR